MNAVYQLLAVYSTEFNIAIEPIHLHSFSRVFTVKWRQVEMDLVRSSFPGQFTGAANDFGTLAETQNR